MRRNDFIKGIKKVMRPVKKMQEAGSFSHKILFETAVAAEATPNREFGVIQTQPRYPKFFQWSISAALLLVMVPVFLVWVVSCYALMLLVSFPAAFIAGWEESRNFSVVTRLVLGLLASLLGPVILLVYFKDFYSDFVTDIGFYRNFRGLWRHIWGK
jgi:hypothetical protein